MRSSRHDRRVLPCASAHPPIRQVEKLELDAADVPFGTELHYFTRWFRETVDEAVGHGKDWRSVVDALRPFNQRIWQGWSDASRKRFLEHVRPIWNIHHHRLPPDLHVRLADAVKSGQVSLIAGKFLDVRREGDDVVATVRRKGVANTEDLRVKRVYDCGGVSVDVEQSSNPAIRRCWRPARRAPTACISGSMSPKAARSSRPTVCPPAGSSPSAR